MISKKKSLRLIKIVTVIFVFSLLIFLAEKRGWFKVFDDRTYDLFHIVKGEKQQPQNVVIIEIDNETFSTLKDEPMAFWGPYFAKAINTLKAAGVTTIGVDTIFTISIEAWFSKFSAGLEEFSRTYDIDFRRELSQGGVVLTGSFATEGGKARVKLPIIEYVYSLEGALNDIGLANLVYDNDGIVRRFTHSYFDPDTPPYLSFASLLAKKHTKDESDIFSEKTFHRIYYFGPSGTFPTISFSRLLNEEPGSDPGLKALKGKVAIIALGMDTRQDMQQTPYATRFHDHAEGIMTGGEVHANIVETIVTKNFQRDLTSFEKIFYFFVFSLISSVIFFKLGSVWGAVSIFLLQVINIMTAGILFNAMLFVPITGTFSVIAVNYLISLGIKFTRGEREKAFLRKTFERYVSGEVVKEMVESGNTPSLGGEMKEITVLFSDIRNFTTISEILEPYEVVEMLNRYFGIICKKILEAGGTVDKFIGDAIMVIFGSPLYYEDHAEKALRTALTMDNDAKEFSKWVSERFEKYGNLPEFRIGIGLHSGMAIIGNVGSAERFEFTAIGDTVNIASRLEGLSKDFDSNIIVSRELLGKIEIDVKTGKSEMIKVKGKNVEIEVVEFIGFNNDDGGPSVDGF